MINVVDDIVSSLFELLKENVIVGGKTIPVFVVDSPDEEKDYIIIRPEGETYAGNKSKFADDVIVVIDIVSTFENNIDKSYVNKIDNEVCSILMPSVNSTISAGAGVQILNLRRENSVYIDEYDGKQKYYRKVSRFRCRALQTT